ncbi:AAEL014804-PA, partial [Aedes aegypti]
MKRNVDGSALTSPNCTAFSGELLFPLLPLDCCYHACFTNMALLELLLQFYCLHLF